MFNDGRWVDRHTEAQYGRFENWLRQAQRLVVIELGAGSDVPSVRRMCESRDAPLIRINPREPEVPKEGDVGIAARALDALQALRHTLR